MLVIFQAFHPIEAVLQFILLPITIFFPFHIPSLVVISIAMFLMSTLSHLGFSIPFYEGNEMVCTTLHHDRHHAILRCNYSVYFPVWDKWMNTLEQKNASSDAQSKGDAGCDPERKTGFEEPLPLPQAPSGLSPK
jgi:sterol desaturase/sphingolipid hydroxylase (fatty acid hydroxylase superfamily)